MASSAAALVVPALKKHTGTVIMAHGLGDSGAGWISLAENWRKRGKFEEISFIFPNAPSIPITVNWGMRMPGWYDIKNFGALVSDDQDEPGILRTRDYFNSLIKTEIDKGIPSYRIILGGFSQGGAMSLLTGVTSEVKLGGIFGLSSYLLLHDKLQSMVPNENPNKDTPIFMGHGDSDPMVKYQWAKMTAEKLTEWGYKVDFHTYKDLVHSVDPTEIDDLEKYIMEKLPVMDQGSQSGL
ncbi:MAG: hypothetical protein M1834_009273 [Cirrosporium novae-zelandiae]|nr:MAG: hypothetical protein M1834_009273 [Cirrosporium novae-zelandiae]